MKDIKLIDGGSLEVGYVEKMNKEIPDKSVPACPSDETCILINSFLDKKYNMLHKLKHLLKRSI